MSNIKINKSIELFIETWREITGRFEKRLSDSYARHILYILDDLEEEIFNNDKFKNNKYAQYFFHSHIKYYIEQIHNIKYYFVEQEIINLNYILESLDLIKNNAFNFHDIKPIIATTKNNLESYSNFKRCLKKLEYLIDKEDIQRQEIKFIIESIIIILNRKGLYLPGSYAKNIFETFSDIKKPNDIIYPSLKAVPKQGKQSFKTYSQKVEKFYNSLTIKDRLNDLNIIFNRKPNTYKVLFNVEGLILEDINEVLIGNVKIFNPKNDESFNEKNFIDKNSKCAISVKLTGIPGNQLKDKAIELAERSLSMLPSKDENEQNIKLSKSYTIYDEKGELSGFASANKSPQKLFKTWSDFKKLERKRFGNWILQNKHPTLRTFLISLNYYRSSIEAEDNKTALLNSWISIENLFKAADKISSKFPNYLLNKPGIKPHCPKLSTNHNIQMIQTIITFCVLRFKIFEEVANICYQYSSKRFPSSLGHFLSDETIILFAEDNSYYPIKFIQNLDKILKELESNSHSDKTLFILKDFFNNSEFAKKEIINRFWIIMDDIYNVYRLRNMIVHTGYTNSVLLDYYTKRSQEFNQIVIDFLSKSFFRSKTDEGILPIEKYFQSILLHTNYYLDTLDKGKNNIFNWVFKTL